MRLEVDEVLAGSRLDRFLVARVPHMSRAKAKRFVTEGWVRVNGRRPKKSQLLEVGDTVALERLPDPPDFRALPDASIELTILHEDDACVVIDKPAGMATHPLAADELGTVANALVHRYPEMVGVGYAKREPGVLHRLDTGTTGVLLAARNAEAFDALRTMLHAGNIDKRYQLLCDGHVRAPDVISMPIARRDAKRMRVCRDELEAERLGGQPARTEILAATAMGANSLVEVRVASARRHQVRVHLAEIGHPLLGDTLYDGPGGMTRHALHASRIIADGPSGPIDVTAPLPDDFRAVIDAN